MESLAVNEPNVLVIPRNSNDTLESYRLIVQKTGGPIARNLLFLTAHLSVYLQGSRLDLISELANFKL
jgi:hypothetical protein